MPLMADGIYYNLFKDIVCSVTMNKMEVDALEVILEESFDKIF